MSGQRGGSGDPLPDGDAQSPSPAESRRDTTRVEAFSDGVFAVAITLLVLNLVVPPHLPGGLLHALGELWPAYLAYLASFLFVGVSWVNHHGVFRRLRSVDRGLCWVNLGILITVVPTPFPTAVLANALRDGNAVDSGTAAAFYGFVFATDAVAWFCFLTYAGRHPHLLHRESDGRLLRLDGLRGLLGIVSYGAAGLLGYLVSPLVALIIYVLLPIFYALTSEGLQGLPGFVRGRH
ncbi:MAG: TMEM175 family protein [Candidatus Dormibacteria bacterium]